MIGDFLALLQSPWLHTLSIPVAEEQHTGILASRALYWLNPLAPSDVSPETVNKSNWTIHNVCTIVLAHDGFDSCGGFISVVEGDGADVMMKNVSFDDSVKELSANKPKFAIDSGSGASSVGPGGGSVVW